MTDASSQRHRAHPAVVTATDATIEEALELRICVSDRLHAAVFLLETWPHVWVFGAVETTFPSGVFPDEDSGRAWIRRHGLSGVLTRYPVGTGMYDVAVATGAFRRDAAFIQRFSDDCQPHVHFEDGEPC